MGSSNDLGLFGKLNEAIQSQKLDENQQITIKVKKSIFGGTRFVAQVVDGDKIKPKNISKTEVESPSEDKAKAEKKSKQVSYRQLLKGASHQSENDKIDAKIIQKIQQLSNRVVTVKDIKELAELEKEASNIQIGSKVKEGLARLKGKITTPARYIGSKTWSIPGQLLLLPAALPSLIGEGVRKLGNTLFNVFKPETSVTVTKPSEYYSFKTPEQLTPEKAQLAIPDMAIAQYAYRNELSELTNEGIGIPGFSPELINDEKRSGINFSFKPLENPTLADDIPGNIEAKAGGVFYDQTTGFKCCVCENNNNSNEITVGFSAANNDPVNPDSDLLNTFVEIYFPEISFGEIEDEGKALILNQYNEEKPNFLLQYYQKNIKDQTALNEINESFNKELSNLISQKNRLLVLDEYGTLEQPPISVIMPTATKGKIYEEALVDFANKYPAVYNRLLEQHNLDTIPDKSTQNGKLLEIMSDPDIFSSNLKKALDTLNQESLNLLSKTPIASKESTLAKIRESFEAQRGLNTGILNTLDSLKEKLKEMDRAIFKLAETEGLNKTPIAQKLQLNADQENFINNSFAAYQIQVGKNQLLGKGSIPKACIQAAAFVKKMKETYPDKTIKLTGFCFGGMLAQYAALKNEVSASCFNSLQLGPKLQQDLGSEKLEKAGSLIEHFSIEEDHITDTRLNLISLGMLPSKFDNLRLAPFDNIINQLGIRTPGNFGKVYQAKLPENVLGSEEQQPNPHSDVMLGLMNCAGVLNLPPPEVTAA